MGGGEKYGFQDFCAHSPGRTVFKITKYKGGSFLAPVICFGHEL